MAGDPLPVLVVDDDSALIRTLSDILSMHGYAPATASTAREGLALATSRIPALAVIDLRLPDMDGMELASRLHELSEMTEVVVLTGNASLESAVAALREHSVDYLLKPVNVEHLLQVASVATERWQRRHAESALMLRAREQAAVAHLGELALSGVDLGKLLEEGARTIADTLQLPYAAVLERRSEGSSLVFRASIGWANIKIGHTSLPVRDDTPSGLALGRDEPVLVPDFDHDSRFAIGADWRAHNVMSAIAVPIPSGMLNFGVLEACDSKPRLFTDDDVHFLQAIAHVLGAAIDRTRAEIAFRQAQRLEAVGRLASGVSHDFNNMLTAITSYAEMVRSALPKESPLRGDVDEILNAAGRAASLTRQLMAFSRQQVLQPRIVLLNDSITGMENMLGRLAGTGVHLVTRLDPRLGLVKADPSQVEQVILNLCVNARDAMPDGGTLTIETSNVELSPTATLEQSINAAGEYVMLAVTDTGVGMDPETKARIFEPFFTTKQEKGTGLGLATVYGIVKQSGGDIWVYSEPGRGTSFKIFLPCAHEISNELPTPQRPTPSGGSETILLAEDEDAIRRVAIRVLEKAGYRVIAAKNGEEAARMAEEFKGTIDLLVSDMMMPLMDGRRLAERLRAKRPHTRVLLLSGYTEATDPRAAPLADAEFLQKPFSTDTLARKVRELLDAGTRRE
jgi:two-component system cell cycle sensor histidine kinase/response regulator CckA